MAKTYQPKRFANPGLLKRLDFALLLRLLEPYRPVFEERHQFSWKESHMGFPFDRLAKILLNPAAPSELLETLYYVETLADEKYFDDLLTAARKLGCDTEKRTVEDLAMLLRLECPVVLERLHAEIYRNHNKHRVKRFESYFAAGEIRPMLDLTQDRLEHIEAELNHWAEENRRGIGMRVFTSRDAQAVWFMIRHGQPMKRENTVESDGSHGLTFYRPEKYDFMIYYPKEGELAMNVRTQKARTAYTQIFGRRLFDDAGYFSIGNTVKYTLNPLLKYGAASLMCWGTPGIDKIRLCEIQATRPGIKNHLEIHRADDLLTVDNENLPLSHRDSVPVKAKFQVAYADGRERIVTIEPPNIALYDRESDHEIIHAWLLERGFILNEPITIPFRGGLKHGMPQFILAIA